MSGGPGGVWTGQWVADRLGLAVETVAAPLGVPLADLVGLAVRRNPRRAHLLVSRVLGKHVPTDPRLVYGAGLLLGELVRRAVRGEPAVPAGLGTWLRAALAGDPQAAAALPAAVTAAQPAGSDRNYPAAVVLGYAETATALGQCVADALRTAPYLHSTRRPVTGIEPVGGFQEEHSHATSHLLLPADPALLRAPAPLVLVDDELSTGTTALNTITALQRLAPRDRYVIAALVDLRADADRAHTESVAAELGTRIDVVALASGRVALPADVLARGRDLVAATDAEQSVQCVVPAPGWEPALGSTRVRRVDLGWPAELVETGRHGVTRADRELLDRHLPGLADTLVGTVARGGPVPRRVLVLGFEELMYVPLRLAAALADTVAGAEVRYSTSTRSPVLTVDDPGYAIRTRLSFPAHDDPADGPGPRHAYNVAAGADPDRRFDTVVLVVDEPADTPALGRPGGLLDQLTSVTDDVAVIVLPDAAARRAGRRHPEEAA